MLAKMVSTGKKTLVLSWDRNPDADGYDIFFGPCGSQACELLKTVKKGSTVSYKIQGLKKGTQYKAYVRAYIKEGNKKTYIGRKSIMVHAIAGDVSGGFTNPAEVTVNPAKVKLGVGQKQTVTGEVRGVKEGKKLLKHCAILRYYTTNSGVATVAGGKITAKGVGKCTIYAVAINGERAEIRITVTEEATTATYKGGKYKLNASKDGAIFTGPADPEAEELTVVKTVKIGENEYPVTEIAAKACSGMEKLKKLTIGSNVKKIGAKAFWKCKGLEKVTIKTKLLTEKSVGSSAFGGGSKKTEYKVPQEKLKAYRKLLVERGVKSKKQVK
jgi:hypothetical protein